MFVMCRRGGRAGARRAAAFRGRAGGPCPVSTGEDLGNALVGEGFVLGQGAHVRRTSVSTLWPRRRATSPRGAPAFSQVVAAAWRQS